MVVIIEVLVSLALLAVSYSFTDLAIVWMLQEAHPKIGALMGWIEFGESHRLGMAVALAGMWILMAAVQLWLLRAKKDRDWFLPVLVVTLVVAMSYPFLSRDIFSYLFAGKMLECYRANPYTTLPKIFFAQDLWLRFTHWIDAKYVYGPVALFLGWLPIKVFGCQRFILSFFSYKLLNWLIFVVTGYGWLRRSGDKNLVLVVWFLNPFLWTEWLMGGHNDLLMVSFWLWSWWLVERSGWWSAILFLVSVLTKYASLGLFWLRWWPKRYFEMAVKLTLGVGMFLLAVKSGNPWYYTWIYMVLPLIILKQRTWLIILGFQLYLVLIYLGFVVTGGWEMVALVEKFRLVPYLVPILVGLSERVWKNNPELGA